MGIYEERQFDRFADSVSLLHDRDTARELWLEGPPAEPEPEWFHTRFTVDHDEHGAKLHLVCRDGQWASLDTVESEDELLYNRSLGWHTILVRVSGLCESCEAYLDVAIGDNETTFTVITDEPAEG